MSHSVTIRPANLRDACFIASKMRQADHDEIAAVFKFTNAAQVAAVLLDQSPGLAFCAYLKGEPVACFGVAHVNAAICSGWAYGTDRIKRAIPAVTDYAVRAVAPLLIAAGYLRLEVKTDITHDLSHRWLEGMGFSKEGVMRSYGFNGEHFALYAITKRDAEHVFWRRSERPAAAAPGSGLTAAADAG
jgi:RimJ/RimL family protein N-acetyltransferase